MLTELDVINNCLATMGEVPLNEVSEDHPLVAAALRDLQQENKRAQKRGWWFNKEEIDLFADTLSGFIYIPTDAIRCDPIDRYKLLPITARGRRLYKNNENTYVFTPGEKVTCILVRNVPFEDLPSSAQDLVNFRTVLSFQSKYDADQAKTSQLLGQASEASNELHREHVRNIKGNNLFKSETLNAMRMIGGQAFFNRGY